MQDDTPFTIYCSYRTNLVKAEGTLEGVRATATRKKATLHAAKNRVQKLKEQLAVAERIVAASETQIETHNQQVQGVSSN